MTWDSAEESFLRWTIYTERIDKYWLRIDWTCPLRSFVFSGFAGAVDCDALDVENTQAEEFAGEHQHNVVVLGLTCLSRFVLLGVPGKTIYYS
jgi:hypothetical protein